MSLTFQGPILLSDPGVPVWGMTRIFNTRSLLNTSSDIFMFYQHPEINHLDGTIIGTHTHIVKKKKDNAWKSILKSCDSFAFKKDVTLVCFYI